MKLWQKSSSTDNLTHSEMVAAFTTQEDKQFDLLLAPYDIAGSIAHAKMLGQTGIISQEESRELVQGLEIIGQSIREKAFHIRPGAEDVHSEIEFRLTELLGETGKKIHTGRSRNDQSLLNIKLYLRDQIGTTARMVRQLALLLLDKAAIHQHLLLPGYTHFQVAMPSSFGLWLGAYAEALTEDLEGIELTYRLINRSPLGSAAGYGSAFPVDRDLCARLLGMKGVHVSSVFAQMTRGRHEKLVAEQLAHIGSSIGKLATDMILYMGQEFRFIRFPDSLTTGSSIMPHKKNPDVLELVRARCNQCISLPQQLSQLCGNLPSGYHRDYQLSKAIVFPALQQIQQSIIMIQLLLQNMEVQEDLMDAAQYQYAFSVEKVNELVMEGYSFREAYHQVAASIADDSFQKPANMKHTHLGSIGNPGLERIREHLTQSSEWLDIIPPPIA